MHATKRKYNKPAIERIPLDNEISMVMMSCDPGGPPCDPFGFVLLSGISTSFSGLIIKFYHVIVHLLQNYL